jgi:hypothetical protein
MSAIEKLAIWFKESGHEEKFDAKLRTEQAKDREKQCAELAQLREERKRLIEPLAAAATKASDALQREQKEAPRRMQQLRDEAHRTGKEYNRQAQRIREAEDSLRKTLMASAPAALTAFLQRLQNARNAVMATDGQIVIKKDFRGLASSMTMFRHRRLRGWTQYAS